MNKTIYIFLLIFIFQLIISCGGVSEDDVSKVWDEYIKVKIADVDNGKKTNDAILQQKAAAKFNYKSWSEFVNKASKSLGTDKWNHVARSKSIELSKKLADINKKKNKDNIN